MLKKILTKVKQLLRHIFLLTAILMVTTPAWAKIWYGRIEAESSPQKKGYIWCTLKGTKFSGSFTSNTTDSSDNDEYNWSSSATFKAEYYAKPIDGYKFIGWYDTNGTFKSNGDANNNYYYSFTLTANSNDKNKPTTVKLYAYFVKYAPSTTTIDFGEVAYNSGSRTSTFTIDCHNIGSWSALNYNTESPFAVTISNNKGDNSEHKATVTVTLSTTASGIFNETLKITTSKGGTLTFTLKANVNANPTYTWNPDYWNADGTQKRAVHVDDIINNVVSSTSKGTITYSYELTNPSVNNNGAIYESKFENNIATCGKTGLLKLTINQEAEQGGYNAGTDTRTILIEKYDITPTINPNTAVWNELVENPFTATTTHKFSGATHSITDFSVAQQNNEHIALMDENTRNIQTYYTNGAVDFLITRPEDYKYNALSQTLTLTVNQNTSGCNLVENKSASISYELGKNDNGTISSPISLNGIGHILSFQYRVNDGASRRHYVTPQYSTETNGDDNFTDFTSYSTTSSTWSETKTIELTNENIKRIRFKRTAETGGTKNIEVRYITVTRAQYLRPTDAEGDLSDNNPLTFPPVAKNQPSSQNFNFSWSACSDIKIVCDNPKFTIGTPDITSNDGTQSISVSCNTSETGTFTGIITIYNQEQEIHFPISCEVRDLTTTYIENLINNLGTIKVGETINTNVRFRNIIETLTNNPKDNFYFTIEHNITTNNTTGSDYPDEVITYDPDNDEITALNKGKAVLKFIHKETSTHYGVTASCTITVDKHTPVFTWQDPVYFNQTIIDYFSTNNTDTEISITQSSTDEDVAILYFDPNNESDKHTLDLTSFYKETTPTSSTQVTVSQAENWYWYAYEEPYTITPRNQDNHVTFTLTQDNYIRDFQVPGGFSDPWADSNGPTWTEGGIHFGQGGLGSGEGGWNWNDKYIIIEFTGIPDSLFFSTTTSTGATTNNPLTSDDDATNTELFYVSAGSTKENLQQIWSSSDNNNTYQDAISPDTRFLKLCYTGNLEGWFKNVTVTELNQFKFTPDTLEFSTIHITDNTTKKLTTNFQYANAGHKINIDLDRTGEWENNEAYELAKKYIAINPASITDIGGEKVGEKEIQITLHSDDKTPYAIPEGAKIKIWDEAGRCDYLTISGLIKPSEQEIIWIPYFQREEPIAIPLETGEVKNAARATSNLPITYETDQPTVIQISADKSYFTPIAVGDATITAIQEGDQKYSRVTSSKKITVTQKMVQIISWSVDLTDLILVDNPDPIALDAKVYLLDLVNNRPVFSQEQTDKIVYSVENEDVVKIVDGQLVIVGLGSTTITAAITETEDSHYESTSLTLPVIVRNPALGCEDILLLDQPTEVEFFTDGINTNEIIKDAMPIDRTLGIPGRVEFQHKGEAWKLFGSVSFYEGSINVQQSTDGGNTWSDVQNRPVTPTLSVYKPTIAALDRNATHIRFVRPSGGQGYHYYKDVKVYPAQYMESEVSNIDFEDINIGGTYTKKINISYSNIKSPIRYESSSSDITVSPSNFGECGKFGTKELTITWKPTTKEGQQTITFIDDLSEIPDLTINLTANIFGRLQEIIWEDRPGAILNHTDIDNRPTYTIDANSKESTSLKIQYEVIEGTENAYFIDDMFFLLNEGDITIKAYHPGNEEYAAVQEIYTFPIQTVPPTFIGTEDQLWNNENNWKNKIMPSEEYSIANIAAPVKIDSLHVDINNVHILDNGSIHITSTGGLTVGKEGIQCANNDGSAIVIDNLHSGAGFFRISPDCEDELPRITMHYQTKSTLDNGANKDATWQYIGAPGANCQFTVDYITWLYHWDEKQGWMNKTGTITLEPFAGYAITQYGQPTYSLITEPTNQNTTITLTKTDNGNGMKGDNLFANSYTAPIDAKNFTPEDFEGDLEKTFYIFNSGSWNDWNKQNQNNSTLGGNDSNTPGQYCAIPALASQYLDNTYDITTIPPMQGVYVIANKNGATIKLDYNKHVWCAGSTENMNEAMRAPQHKAQMQDENFRRIRIQLNSTNSGADRMYVIQTSETTSEYDNGYDAPNLVTEGLANIYTTEPFGNMEVSCSNNIDSMSIGFQAGVDTEYTLSFGALIGDSLYLQDLENDSIIQIVEKEQYHFTATPYSINNHRFQLLLHRQLSSNNDNTTTAIEDIYNTTKIWSQDKTVYILNAPENSIAMIYSVSGHHILSTPINNHPSPAVIDLYQLPEGVYIIRINNQMYKFVCK